MAKTINFFDGAQSSTVPTIGNIDATSLVQYADDASFEAANAGSPLEGNIYANTTTNSVRYYNGTAWINLADDASTQTFQNKTIDGTSGGNNTVTIDAEDATYDNATSGLTATDAQAAIDEVEGRLDTAESSITTNASDITATENDIADIRTTTGTSDGDTDMGTFTGTTISDNISAKSALQELETALEALGSPLTLQGSWNASTNTPTLTSGVGTQGHFYIVTVAGSTNLDGITDWQINDWAVYDGTGWIKVDNSEVVTSVNGETGDVVLTLDDIDDVSAAGPSDRNVIRYDNGGSNWVATDLDSVTDDITAGSNVTLGAVSDSVVRVTNGSLVSIDMIPAGYNGQKFVLINRNGGALLINDDTGATAANRIYTGTGAQLALTDNTAITFIYDSTEARWQISGGSGGGSDFPALDNNQALTGRNAADSADVDLINLNASDDIILGTGAFNTRVASTNFIPNGATGNLGGGSNAWNFYPNRVFGSLIHSGSGGIRTEDTTITGNLINKTGDSSAGDSGEVSLESGAATGGNSGNVCIRTGTATGTRGSIEFVEGSLAGSTVSDVWTLQNTTTGAGAWVTPPAAGNKNVASFGSTATAGSTDDIILLSGASFTLTLATASGNSGKVVEIIHQGTSLSQVYTVDGNAAETIRGNATFLMHTNGQRVRLVSDGSNWLVLDSFTKSEWATAGTITVSATTTGPTKGSVQSHDIIRWRRVGDSAHIRMNFRQTSATGSAAGSGDYLFDVTAIGSIDTAKVDVYSSVEGWNSSFQNAFNIGNASVGDGSTQALAEVVPYDATYVRIFGLTIAQAGVVGSAGYPLSAANVMYSLDFIVPISGWES